MKLHEKVRFRLRQYGYEHKKIKSLSREFFNKIEEIDKYLEKEMTKSRKRKK
ncbi:MAG TPA: hypothetical protein PLL17_03245 [Defluviitaleaceae bacterium]|jgi:hypothetical protein|nr:hypothetical protein [Candidatus Epulonipiscium sp.]HQD50137.1 hypothetical protein [Defluviitaleaceae bacterium]